MPNSTKIKTLTLSDGTYNNTLPLEDTTARNNITSLANSLATVATSGSYNDLSNKPTIPSAPGTLNTNNTSAQSASSSEALSGTIKLHKVSKTGNYNDLLNKPSLADVATSGSYNDLTDVPSSTGTLEVVFTYETDHYECDAAIDDIIAAIEDGTRVFSNFVYNDTTFVVEALFYQQSTNETFLSLGCLSNGYLYSFAGSNSSSTGGLDDWSFKVFEFVDHTVFTNWMATKQDLLDSGVNIKTINNQSLLGSGNITIQGGGGGGDVNVIEVVKVNGSALSVDSNKAVDITAVPWSIVTNKPTIPDVSGKADKVSGGVTGHIAELDANGNLADGGVLASDVEDAVTKKHTHSNKEYLDKIPSSNGTNGQVLTSNGTSWSWQTPSGGGLTNYDYTHTVSSGVSGTVAVTFPANQRCSVMYGATADIALAITCNNGADNYIWVKNNGSAAIDITISSVTYNNTSLAASKIFLPSDGISVDKGCVCEIGVLCNADGAFITARGDLKASS